jgi:hypothetical protein
MPKTSDTGPPPKLRFRDPLTNEEVKLPDEEREIDAQAPAATTSGDADSDSSNIMDRYGLRIMSWNLQDLGGGPSRSPKRTDKVIRDIAAIIEECDPDICVILEVKQQIWLPRKPISIGRVVRTRLAKKRWAEEEDQRIDMEKRHQERIELWKKRKEEIEGVAAAMGTEPPGVLELKRIVSELKGYRLSVSPFTEREAYGFIYKEDVLEEPTGDLVNKDREDAELYWPEPGFRVPAKVTFSIRNSTKQQLPDKIDIIAFHAPAPRHGKITKAAVESFNKVAWARNTVVVGDFNLDTESSDGDTADDADDAFLALEQDVQEYWVSIGGSAEGTFAGDEREGDVFLTGQVSGAICLDEKVGPPQPQPAFLTGEVQDEMDLKEKEVVEEKEVVPTQRKTLEVNGNFTGIATIDNQTVWLKGKALMLTFDYPLIFRIIDPPDDDQVLTNILLRRHMAFRDEKALQGVEEPASPRLADLEGRQGVESVAAESGKTSLRKKVKLEKYDPFNGSTGKYDDTEVFNCAGYDKIFVRSYGEETLRPIQGWTYPLFERCLLETDKELLKWFGISNLKSKQEKEASRTGPKRIRDISESNEEESDSEKKRKRRRLEGQSKSSDSNEVRETMLQSVLKAANQISDHVPMILDVELVRLP